MEDRFFYFLENLMKAVISTIVWPFYGIWAIMKIYYITFFVTNGSITLTWPWEWDWMGLIDKED